MADTSTLNIPVFLTLLRIVAVPVLLVCLLLPYETARWIAVLVFIGAAVTDWLDGVLARALGQTSALGRMLDPIADKLIVAVVLLVLVSDRTIPHVHVVAAAAILAREIFVSGLREYLGGRGVVVPVTVMAKWKTSVQLAALLVLIAGPLANFGYWIVWWLGIALLWVAALMALVTGYDYTRSGLPVLQGETPQP